MTKLPVQKEKKLDDGVHHGVIKEVRFRTEPYSYTDLVIELADGFSITAGYPTIVTKNSKLGLLLERFGAALLEGSDVEVEQYFIGKDVSFITMTEKGKDGKMYARVMSDSVKPLVPAEKVA